MPVTGEGVIPLNIPYIDIDDEGDSSWMTVLSTAGFFPSYNTQGTFYTFDSVPGFVSMENFFGDDAALWAFRDTYFREDEENKQYDGVFSDGASGSDTRGLTSAITYEQPCNMLYNHTAPDASADDFVVGFLRDYLDDMPWSSAEYISAYSDVFFAHAAHSSSYFVPGETELTVLAPDDLYDTWEDALGAAFPNVAMPASVYAGLSHGDFVVWNEGNTGFEKVAEGTPNSFQLGLMHAMPIYQEADNTFAGYHFATDADTHPNVHPHISDYLISTCNDEAPSRARGSLPSRVGWGFIIAFIVVLALLLVVAFSLTMARTRLSSRRVPDTPQALVRA